jgi:hypothetical protein
MWIDSLKRPWLYRGCTRSMSLHAGVHVHQGIQVTMCTMRVRASSRSLQGLQFGFGGGFAGLQPGVVGGFNCELWGFGCLLPLFGYSFTLFNFPFFTYSEAPWRRFRSLRSQLRGSCSLAPLGRLVTRIQPYFVYTYRTVRFQTIWVDGPFY